MKQKAATQDAVVSLTKALLSLLKHVEGLERRIANNERALNQAQPAHRSKDLDDAFDSVAQAIDALERAGDKH